MLQAIRKQQDQQTPSFQRQVLRNFMNQVISSLQSFNFIINNEYIIMNYQLLLSHEKQKYNHNLGNRYNYSSLSRYTQQKPLHSPIESQFSFQSPMPIKLVHYKPQSRTLPDQSYSDNKPHKIRYKIKQKKVHLPSIDQRDYKMKAMSRSFQPYTYKIVKKRAKTQTNHHGDSEQNILRMSQNNNRLPRYKQSRAQKYTPRYRQQDQRDKPEKKDENRYNHRSKQRQFEEYVHQIQNKYRRSQSRTSLPQQAQIQQKLKHRIQTKKYFYCKPFNPENNQHQKEIKSSSLSHSRFTKKTIKQQIEEESQTTRNLQDEDDQRQRKRNEINEDFIKILRKAKNRGASLLIKLKKFPSKKLEAT